MDRRHFITSAAGALAASSLPASAANAEPKTVWGIAELWQWLYEKQQTSGHDSADCLQAHLDHGIRHVVWALGRSTLDYHSALPTSTMYAGDTRPETKAIGDTAVLDPQLKALLGPLLPRLGDADAVGESLAVSRKKRPQMNDNERWFGLDNHSLLPQLSGSPRLKLDTI